MIRCLVVDDSRTFRSVLRSILEAAPGVQVAGEAENGEQALALALSLRPDVITMDVQMPGQGGLAATAEIMRKIPTPIVVICSGADDASLGISLDALKLGAVEVLAKPKAGDPAAYARQADAIRLAVRAVAGLTLVTRRERRPVRAAAEVTGRRPPACLALAASTGGPAALRQILGALPAGFPIPILVVQHIVDGFLPGMVRWLAGGSALSISVAEAGAPLRPGCVYFAPDGSHLVPSGGRIRLDSAPEIRGFRPSATALFAGVAREFGSEGAGVLLTGMGEDGAAGLKLLRDRGGFTAAQGEASSVVFGMPRAARELKATELFLELGEIAGVLLRLAGPAPGRPRDPEPR